jgi:hypothetical protein
MKRFVNLLPGTKNDRKASHEHDIASQQGKQRGGTRQNASCG